MLLVCVVLFCVVFVSGGSRHLEGTSLRNCQREQTAASELTFVPNGLYELYITACIAIIIKAVLNNVNNYVERIMTFYIIKFI